MWLVARRTPSDTVPVRPPKEKFMEPRLIEWGPAHLRDEPAPPEIEPDDRPDDN